MINVLPYEYKAEIRAGRTNVILIRYITILLLAAVVLGGLVAGSYVVISGTKANAEQKAAENDARLLGFQKIRTDADEFRSDLATSRAIIDSGVSFSKLVYDIADTIPEGVVLDNLTLDPATFGTPITINANAKQFSDGTRLRDELAANTKVFSGVQLLSIRSSDASAGSTSGYPVQVSLSVTINKGAAQ